MIYYIEDCEGNVGHPTKKHDMIRRWLKSKKAKIKKRSKDWMLIKIHKKIDPEKTIPAQFRVGLDPGYENVGFAVFKLTETKVEKILEGEAKLRTSEVTENMTERKMHRNTRRGYRRENVLRKFDSCKFRHPIWKNRKKHKFQPTHIHLIQSHVNILKKIFQLVPFDESHVVVEYAKFDSQKINNPNIKNYQYQKGPQYGFENVKNYVRARDNYTCQICKKKDEVIHVHHIQQRSQHGTDTPDNLVTLCKPCHDKVHKGHVKCPRPKSNTFVASGVLNSIMNELYEIISSEVSTSKTYGYVTDTHRKSLGLEKTHYGDASIIAFCDEDSVLKANEEYIDNTSHMFLQQFRRHNRSFTMRVEDRKYKINGSTVAWNRNRREGQDKNKDSLTEFQQEYGYHKTSVSPGVVRSRRSNKDMLFRPGDTIKIAPTRKNEIFISYVDICKGWASTHGAVIGVHSTKEIPMRYVYKKLKNSGLVIDNIF